MANPPGARTAEHSPAYSAGGRIATAFGPGPPATGWPIRFDERNLWPAAPGRRFNPSILEDGDGYLFAVRDRFYYSSNIIIGRLDAGFRPVGRGRRLELVHADADTSREDPRLFRYRGQPHVAFMGATHGVRAPTQNQLYARLSADGMTVQEVFAPHYPARQRWEKNWSFFEHLGDLYAVYSFSPCRILKIEANDAIPAYETRTASIWQGGEIRGGAAPARVSDELWCFTHDRLSEGPWLHYRTGLVALEADPPFGVSRMLDRPILIADRATKPVSHYASVVFAGGAVRCGDDWVVAHGVHDRWSELHSFSHADLDGRLVPVRRGAVADAWA